MANPQTLHGHVRIANDLYEALYSFDFTLRELRLLLALIRETYGWGRKQSQISVNTLAVKTGLDRSHATRVMRGLQEKNVVTCLSEPDFRAPGVYGLQKDWEQWGVELLGDTPSPGLPRGAESAPLAESARGAESAHPEVLKVPIQRCSFGTSDTLANADGEGIVEAPKDSTKNKYKDREAGVARLSRELQNATTAPLPRGRGTAQIADFVDGPGTKAQKLQWVRLGVARVQKELAAGKRFNYHLGCIALDYAEQERAAALAAPPDHHDNEIRY